MILSSFWILIILIIHTVFFQASAEAWGVMASVCSEQRIWRELVMFHFNPSQIDCAFTKLNIQNDDKVDWKVVYHSLRK